MYDWAASLVALLGVGATSSLAVVGWLQWRTSRRQPALERNRARSAGNEAEPVIAISVGGLGALQGVNDTLCNSGKYEIKILLQHSQIRDGF